MRTSSWSLEQSSASAELKRFVSEKLAQVRAEPRAAGHEMASEFKALFAAAERGDWRMVSDSLKEAQNGMQQDRTDSSKARVVYPVEWSAALEIAGAFEQFAAGDENYAAAFGRDIIASIPPGSIYFGGTDAGRCLVTALSKSHVNGDPFFTLTQNALADRRSYLRYARSMYGNRIYIPTEQDATSAYDHYLEDAQRRLKENKLRPGEDLGQVDGKMQVRGAISVMAINGALSQLMFDKNPNREFYLEESFPLEWTCPHLEPHGLILKINRQPLPQLSGEVVRRDHEYWIRYIRPMIGDWLNYDMPLTETVAFVEKIYLKHDLSGFGGDPRYVQNDMPQKNFGKLRSSIGGVYVWRAQNAKSTGAKERMVKEADFAFRQAFALSPGNPEVVFRYVSLLLAEKRLDEAILVAETGQKVETETPVKPETRGPNLIRSQLGALVEQLKNMKKN